MNYAQIAGPGDVWFDPSYDEAQGWTPCPVCDGACVVQRDGEGHFCDHCGGEGGEFEGKLMSEQAYEQQMRLERKERT